MNHLCLAFDSLTEALQGGSPSILVGRASLAQRLGLLHLTLGLLYLSELCRVSGPRQDGFNRFALWVVSVADRRGLQALPLLSSAWVTGTPLSQPLTVGDIDKAYTQKTTIMK